jgi:hypothetical protein
MVNRFVREGVVSGEIGWTVEVASLGRSVLIPHAIDMAYLDVLVRHRGQIIGAAMLSSLVGGVALMPERFEDDGFSGSQNDSVLASVFGGDKLTRHEDPQLQADTTTIASPGFNTWESRQEMFDAATVRSLRSAVLRDRKDAAVAAMDGDAVRSRQLAARADNVEKEIMKYAPRGKSRQYRNTNAYRATSSVRKQLASAINRITTLDLLIGQYLKARVLNPTECKLRFPVERQGWMFDDEEVWVMSQAWETTGVSVTRNGIKKEVEAIMREVEDDTVEGREWDKIESLRVRAVSSPAQGMISGHVRQMAMPWMQGSSQEASDVADALRRAADFFKASGYPRMALHREGIADRIEDAIVGERFGLGGGGKAQAGFPQDAI